MLLLASVVDLGDAAVLASGTPGAVDAGPVDALLGELVSRHVAPGTARIRLVATPDEPVLGASLAALARCSAAGHPVDALIVARVPRRGDGWPAAWARAQRERLAEFAPRCPVPVIPVRLRPRRRAIGRTLPGAPMRELPAAGDPVPAGDGLAWHLPVDALDAIGDLRVGTSGEDLVLELDGVQVRRRLPALLTRCRATGARADGHGITVAFAREGGSP